MQSHQWMRKLVDPRFDWRMLQAFLDVAECGTFRAAGIQRLFAINTLRWRVEELERLVGCQLVMRNVKGLLLTQEGEALKRVVCAMADARAETVAAQMELPIAN